MYSEEIATMKRLLSAFPDLAGFDEALARTFVEKYDSDINDAISEVFEGHKFSKRQTQSLKDIVALLLYKDFFAPSAYSGIVIAGFGEREVFPALDSFIMDGVIGGKLRYRRHIKQQAGHQMQACVLSFAQSDAVYQFMDGVHPDYRREIDDILSKIISKYSEIVPLSVPSLSEKDQAKMSRRLKAFGEKFLRDVTQYLDGLQRRDYSDPIVEAVQVLPRDELASMAETLVQLTSFRQRVSLNYETVGGPIDVAVISKGDGFVWIKRKHYFEPGLNHQFFVNYNRQAGGGADERETG